MARQILLASLQLFLEHPAGDILCGLNFGQDGPICCFAYYQLKHNICEMDEVCTIRGARWEMHTKFLLENPNRKEQI